VPASSAKDAPEIDTLAAPPPPPPPAPAPALPPPLPPKTTPPPSEKAPKQVISVPSDNRNALLDQIRSGKNLKEVKPNEALPSLKTLSSQESNSLAGILAKAMASRRTDIKQDTTEEEDSSWDD
jgi:hypothetical protein